MSKQEFLENFRIAQRFFAHPRVEADSSKLDPRELEKMIARAAIWLTPRSAKGFNVDDFPELGPQRQQELQAAIDEFLAIARQVPPSQPASPQQHRAATAAFTKLVSLLEPYVPTPDEEKEVVEALEKVDLPPWVVNFYSELGSDQDGEPAVWINLYADETVAPRKEFGRFASQWLASLRQALSAVGNHRWPYLRLRTAMEHKTF